MRIELIHGIVDSWSPERQAHYNYVPTAALEIHLRHRRDRYRAWESANEGGVLTSSVLTIDDATRGGAAACMLARRLGHDVHFFVNPLQIDSGRPYLVSLLDAVVDGSQVTEVTYQGVEYNLTTFRGARRLRKAVKSVLMVRSISEGEMAVEELRHLLSAADAQVENHALPISRGELNELGRAGVRIESHGWSHVEIGTLMPSQLTEHITRSRRWIRDEVGIDAQLYAVPFGLSRVPATHEHLVANGYFLVNPNLPLGSVGRPCWNRFDLTSELQSR